MKHRRSIRLKNFDYSRQGWYFVTICLQKRLCLLGKVQDFTFHPNEAGEMVAEEWLSLPSRFGWVMLEDFVIMPNHFHGIIVFAEANESKTRLGDVIGAWKSITTVAYGRGVSTYGWQRFSGTLWQRGYYERIIRDGHELEVFRNYMYHNPAQWEMDQLHPENPSKW